MAKGNTAPKVQTSGDRKNGKAVKKNPGPKQMEKTNFTHVNGRTAKSYEKREAWKAAGGTATHPSIPHWKTGKVFKADAHSILVKAQV